MSKHLIKTHHLIIKCTHIFQISVLAMKNAARKTFHSRTMKQPFHSLGPSNQTRKTSHRNPLNSQTQHKNAGDKPLKVIRKTEMEETQKQKQTETARIRQQE